VISFLRKIFLEEKYCYLLQREENEKISLMPRFDLIKKKLIWKNLKG